MSFPNSPGVYDRIVNRSFVVNAGGTVAGGVVISAKKGPVGVNIVTGAREFIETYGLPSRDNPSMYAALRFLNRSGILSVRRVVNNAVAASGSFEAAVGDHEITITATNPGAWGNDIRVTFVAAPDLPEGHFYLVVSDVDDGELERYEVSQDVDAKNGYGRSVFIEDVVNGRSRYISVDLFGTFVLADLYAETIALADGTDDTVAPTSGHINSAWDDFINPDLIPAQLLINAGWAVPEVQVKMLSIAQTRKDSVAILDVPEDLADDVAGMIDYRKTELGVDSYFGGLYGGWLRIYDQYNDRETLIPASGDVAAVFATTLEVGERWDAPAGLQRGIIPNALGVSRTFSEGERDLLYVAGINPVTTYAGANAVVWGQKTLAKQASALDRFNVVNLILWMNTRMVQALQPFVFQPNTKFTRDSVNFLLSNFLENLRVRGGLYAFRVDTSEDINTPFVIDNNQMLVDVYVQPTRTSEFIRISTIVTPTGVQLA